jgi:hypothetical protein
MYKTCMVIFDVCVRVRIYVCMYVCFRQDDKFLVRVCVHVSRQKKDNFAYVCVCMYELAGPCMNVYHLYVCIP